MHCVGLMIREDSECQHLQAEVTGVAASLGRGTGLLLEPCDELVDGEGLGEGRA